MIAKISISLRDLPNSKTKHGEHTPIRYIVLPWAQGFFDRGNGIRWVCSALETDIVDAM
jgi:hypothetical protein